MPTTPTTTHGGYAGRSLIEMLWELADDAYDRLCESEPGNSREVTKGECRMAAQMLAVMTSKTYNSIRTEMKSRWTATNSN